MKNPFLFGIAGITLVAVTATTLYAQTVASTSLVDKMKAAVSAFTLAGDLNPGQTGLQSAPVSGKKTGDILTAGEWNRVLELVSEGGSGAGWVNVPLDTAEFDKSCEYRFQTITPTNTVDDPYMGNDPYHYVNAVDNDRLTWFILPGSYHHINFDSKTIYRVNGVPNTDATISKIEKRCGGGGSSDWENVSLSDTADYDTTCLYEVNVKTTAAMHNNLMNGDTSWRTGTARTNKYLGLAFTDGSATTYASWGVPSSTKSTYGYRDSAGTFVPSSGVSILGMRKFCGGSHTTANSVTGPAYINPDNTDFAPLACTPGVNYMINPIAFSAESASSFTTKKVAVLGAGNWQVKGTGFVRIRNKNSDVAQALRISSIIDGTTTNLLDNSVDIGMYANSFQDPVNVPAGKTAELRVSVKNNTLHGGDIVAWCN